MIERLIQYRDDKGRLEVEVELSSAVRRTFIVREDEYEEGSLSFTALPAGDLGNLKSCIEADPEVPPGMIIIGGPMSEGDPE